MEQLKAEIKAMEAETGALNAAAQRHQSQMLDNTINAMRGATMGATMMRF